MPAAGRAKLGEIVEANLSSYYQEPTPLYNIKNRPLYASSRIIDL